MGKTYEQSDQIIHVSTLSEIATSANTELKDILTNINATAKFPLPVSVSNRTLTIGTAKQQARTSGFYRGITPWAGVDFNSVISNSNAMNFDNGSGTNAMSSTTLPSMTASYYIRAGVQIDSSGSLSIAWGTQAASASSASLPAFNTNYTPVMEILLQDDGTGGQGHFSNLSTANITVYTFHINVSAQSMSTVTINNNGSTVIGLSAFESCHFSYSAKRADDNRMETGLVMITTDGTNTGISHSTSSTANVGLTFTVAASPFSLTIANNTGYSVTLKYRYDTF